MEWCVKPGYQTIKCHPFIWMKIGTKKPPQKNCPTHLMHYTLRWHHYFLKFNYDFRPWKSFSKLKTYTFIIQRGNILFVCCWRFPVNSQTDSLFQWGSMDEKLLWLERFFLLQYGGWPLEYTDWLTGGLACRIQLASYIQYTVMYLTFQLTFSA